MVAKEPKTAVLSVRVRPAVKTMLEALAKADDRSLAHYLERLIEATYAAQHAALPAKTGQGGKGRKPG
jgi:predicted transcriptional regulator